MSTPSRCDHCALALEPGVRYCPGCGAVVSWHTPTAETPAFLAAFLLVHVPGSPVRQVPLEKPIFRVGRGAHCEVVVDHPRVSRLHAILELRDGAHRISDARSSGGTFLNDRPVHGATALVSGDTIRLGRDPEDAVILVYHLGG